MMIATQRSKESRRQRIVATLLDRLPGRFSVELGLDLESGRPRDVFLWFLASVLYGARISGAIVARTHREFIRRGLTTPHRILRIGWDGVVEVLDAGGYTRYDFKTATKLLDIMRSLSCHYGGDLNKLHEAAEHARDLDNRLKALAKGIGDVTVQIFLRELRGIWPKADPPISPLAALASDHLRLTAPAKQRTAVSQVQALKNLWKVCRVRVFRFSDFESALVRLGRDYCRPHRQDECPMQQYCGGRGHVRAQT